jgi:Flp pilus assembly pilin Flp
MFEILHKRRAQSLLEYAMLIILISIAVAAMQQYITRSVNARLKQTQVELDEAKR